MVMKRYVLLMVTRICDGRGVATHLPNAVITHNIATVNSTNPTERNGDGVGGSGGFGVNSMNRQSAEGGKEGSDAAVRITTWKEREREPFIWTRCRILTVRAVTRSLYTWRTFGVIRGY